MNNNNNDNNTEQGRPFASWLQKAFGDYFLVVTSSSVLFFLFCFPPRSPPSSSSSHEFHIIIIIFLVFLPSRPAAQQPRSSLAPRRHVVDENDNTKCINLSLIDDD